MVDAPPPRDDRTQTADPADIEDDRHDPGRAKEIDSRHEAHSPMADPIIPTRPRAPLGPWLWISAVAALVLVLAIAALVSQL